MTIEIRQAQEEETGLVASVLTEAALWLNSIGQPLWQCNELEPECIAGDVRNGLYYLVWLNEEAVGTLKFQIEDELFWPDVPLGSSAFVHRLAIKRKVAGKGIAALMLKWAKDRANALGRNFLRLDCAVRPQLCAFYERNGFTRHSERQVGPYFVVRYEYDTRKTMSTSTVSWYSIDKNLSTIDRGAVTKEEAMRIIDGYFVKVKPHYELAEEALAETMFGFQKSKDEFIEFSINAPTEISFKYEISMPRKILFLSVPKVVQKERTLRSKEEVQVEVSSFYDLD